MTEEEAKKKWCPYAKDVYITESGNGIAGASFTRHSDGTIPESCKCVASACMSWRWKYAEDKTQPEGGISFKPRPLVKAEFGYCGLAGKT